MGALVHNVGSSGNLRKTFDNLDQDNSGFIDKTELSALLKELEIPAGETDVKMALATMDTSKDDKISFEEFKNWFKQAETRINNQIAEAFQQIDSDHNGFIEKENLELVINKLGAENQKY